jgi:hypothetical protein
LADPHETLLGLPHVDRDVIQSVRRASRQSGFYDAEEAALRESNGELWDFVTSRANAIAHGDSSLKQEIMRFGGEVLEAVRRAEGVETLKAMFEAPDAVDPAVPTVTPDQAA